MNEAKVQPLAKRNSLAFRITSFNSRCVFAVMCMEKISCRQAQTLVIVHLEAVGVLNIKFHENVT